MLNGAWRPALIGAVAFAAAHAIEAAAHIGGPQPWFIGALPSALLTSAVIFAAGVLAGWQGGGGLSTALLSGVALTAGATVPLVLLLFAHPGGPGNLFPIAIMIGVALVACCAIAGAFAGSLARHARGA
jgi:hypothetical protein